MTAYYDQEGGLKFSVAVSFVNGVREGNTVRNEIEDPGYVKESVIFQIKTVTPYKKGKIDGVLVKQKFILNKKTLVESEKTSYVAGVKQGLHQQTTYHSDGSKVKYAKESRYLNGQLHGAEIVTIRELDPANGRVLGSSMETKTYRNGKEHGAYRMKRFSATGALEETVTVQSDDSKNIIEKIETFHSKTGKLASRTLRTPESMSEETTYFQEDGKTVQRTEVKEDLELVKLLLPVKGGSSIIVDYNQLKGQLNVSCKTAGDKPCEGVVDGKNFKNGLLQGKAVFESFPASSSFSPLRFPNTVFGAFYVNGVSTRDCETFNYTLVNQKNNCSTQHSAKVAVLHLRLIVITISRGK